MEKKEKKEVEREGNARILICIGVRLDQLQANKVMCEAEV